MSKVYSIVIKANFDCAQCHEKINKAICSLCPCEIHSRTFDEKSNTITLIGIFDPKKAKEKIRQKAHKWIDCIEVSEVVKKQDSGDDNTGEKGSAKKKDGPKEKGGDKDGPKEKDTGVKQMVQPAPNPNPAPPPDPTPKPQTAIIVYNPPAVTGAPVGWCHCGPCHCGGHYPPCLLGHGSRPCTCGCSNWSSIYGQGRSSDCVIFSHEDSTCRIM